MNVVNKMQEMEARTTVWKGPLEAAGLYVNIHILRERRRVRERERLFVSFFLMSFLFSLIHNLLSAAYACRCISELLLWPLVLSFECFPMSYYISVG